MVALAAVNVELAGDLRGSARGACDVAAAVGTGDRTGFDLCADGAAEDGAGDGGLFVIGLLVSEDDASRDVGAAGVLPQGDVSGERGGRQESGGED